MTRADHGWLGQGMVLWKQARWIGIAGSDHEGRAGEEVRAGIRLGVINEFCLGGLPALPMARSSSLQSSKTWDGSLPTRGHRATYNAVARKSDVNAGFEQQHLMIGPFIFG